MTSQAKLLKKVQVCAIAGALLGGVVTTGAQVVPTVRALTEGWPETLVVDGIEIVPVLKNVYMLAGGGANVTVGIGDEGVVMIDTGAPGNATKLQNAIRRLTRKPLRSSRSCWTFSRSRSGTKSSARTTFVSSSG